MDEFPADLHGGNNTTARSGPATRQGCLANWRPEAQFALGALLELLLGLAGVLSGGLLGGLGGLLGRLGLPLAFAGLPLIGGGIVAALVGKSARHWVGLGLLTGIVSVALLDACFLLWVCRLAAACC